MPLQPVLAKHQVPPEYQGIGVNKNNVIVSALKKTDNENNYTLRLYEVTGEDTDVTITLPFTIEKLWSTDMIEENGKEIQTGTNSFTGKNWP